MPWGGQNGPGPTVRVQWIGTIIDNYRRHLQSSRWYVQKQRTTSLDGVLSAQLGMIPVKPSRFDAIHLTTVDGEASREIDRMHRHSPFSPSARARRRTSIRSGWPVWTSTISSHVRSTVHPRGPIPGQRHNASRLGRIRAVVRAMVSPYYRACF